MNDQEQLHRLVDRLNVHDVKEWLHVLLNEISDETARQILADMETIRRRRPANHVWVTLTTNGITVRSAATRRLPSPIHTSRPVALTAVPPASAPALSAYAPPLMSPPRPPHWHY